MAQNDRRLNERDEPPRWTRCPPTSQHLASLDPGSQPSNRAQTGVNIRWIRIPPVITNAWTFSTGLIGNKDRRTSRCGPCPYRDSCDEPLLHTDRSVTVTFLPGLHATAKKLSGIALRAFGG